MSPDKLYRIEGIVMRRRDQGEADRVLKLCTPMGKIEVIAKGTRKLRSRKAGHVELFSKSWFVVSRVTNSWDIVSQADMVEPHRLLRNDLLRGTYARYAVELLDRFFVDGQGDRDLFDLLDRTLARLCEDSDLDLIARYYEQRLLWLAGFRPEVFHCVGEHVGHMSLRPKEPSEDERTYGFDPEQGGALCPSCHVRYREREDVIDLSPDGLWLLQECQRRPYVRLKNQRIPPALHGEVELVMQRYITYHLERDVQSRVFLNQLKREGVENP